MQGHATSLRLVFFIALVFATVPAIYRLCCVLISMPLDTDVGNVNHFSQKELQSAYDGKSALIVGGTHGIGRAIAISLANHGASVSIVGRSGDSDVLHSMRAVAHSDLQVFSLHTADLSTVAGSVAFAADLRQHSGAFDFLIFTVGVWPNFSDPFTADGIEKVIALDVLARFILLTDIRSELLRPGTRVMSVLASTWNLPVPQDVRAILRGETKSYSLSGILSTAAVATDAMLHAAARRFPSLHFIGMHPGVLRTGLGASTFGAWNNIFNIFSTPIANSEKECGEIHAHVLIAPNAVNKIYATPTFFNEWMEARRPAVLAADYKFQEWVWEWLNKTVTRFRVV